MSFNSSTHALGGQAAGRKERAEAIARYYANPNYCLNCGSIIEVKDSVKVAKIRTKRFCNRSCAGAYNNKLFHKRHRKKQCASCGDLILTGRKYCSEICRTVGRKSRTPGSTSANKSTYVVSWRQKAKLRAIKYKGGCCQICGYDKCVRALSFHHLDVNHKDFGISAVSRSWSTIQAELDKCVLLCLNCHAEVHAGLLKFNLGTTYKDR